MFSFRFINSRRANQKINKIIKQTSDSFKPIKSTKKLKCIKQTQKVSSNKIRRDKEIERGEELLSKNCVGCNVKLAQSADDEDN